MGHDTSCAIGGSLRADRAHDRSWSYYGLKRGMDILVAAGLFFCAAPLMVVVALAIRMDSPGPALFRHTRTGLDRRRKRETGHPGPERRREHRFGRQFTLYKFRTMYVDAAERFPDFYRYEYSAEEFVNLRVGRPFRGGRVEENDPRVTRLGRWLRRTSIDELPNLLNVLKGDMSIVGPRPDVWQHIRYYPPEHLEKLRAKPGLTCLAQILGRGTLTFLQTNEHDLVYVRNRSTLTDLRIFLKTIRVVLTREGAL